jgi:hypothetical protein
MDSYTIKTQKILDSMLEWDEDKLVLRKESSSVTLSQREVIALFIVLREIISEWKSSQKK